jgi:hypothetical protein
MYNAMKNGVFWDVNIPEDAILLSHCRENLKSYMYKAIFVGKYKEFDSECESKKDTSSIQMA